MLHTTPQPIGWFVIPITFFTLLISFPHLSSMQMVTGTQLRNPLQGWWARLLFSLIFPADPAPSQRQESIPAIFPLEQSPTPVIEMNMQGGKIAAW